MKPFVGLLALLAAPCALAQFGVVPGGGYSNVQFAPLAQGVDLTTNSPGIYTFNNAVAFEDYWRTNHRGAGPVLQANFFQSWRLVAIHAGNRPGVGYGLGVTGITRRIDRATISAIETVPPAPRDGRNGRRAPSVTTSPWVLLRVERGAFDFALQTRQVQGYGGATNASGLTSVKVGGATVTFGPGGYGYP